MGAVFTAIFKGAFGLRAVGGGIVGSGVKLALTWGMKRGVFSNEAGLGSSVMVHSSSNVKEPVRQGMWGIFEVFADTMVVCTLTAFAVLSSGLIDLDTGAVLVDVSGSALVGQALLPYSAASALPSSPLRSCCLHSLPYWAGATTDPRPVNIYSVRNPPLSTR